MQDELDHATGFMKRMLAQQESSSVFMLNQVNIAEFLQCEIMIIMRLGLTWCYSLMFYDAPR